MWSFFKVNQWLRYFVLGLSFAYLGIIMGGGASTNDVLRSLSGHSPVLESDLYWYSLVIIALALIPIAGRFYCGWLCPFGALTDVSFLLVPSQWEIPGNVHRYLRFAKYAILGIVLLLGLLPGASTAAVYAVGVVEPFATLFKLQWDLLSWVFLIPILLFSLFVPRFYCRYFCPLGAFFALLAGASSLLGLRLMRPSLPEDSCKGCRLAQKECRMNAISYDASSRRPDVDRSECLMCNRCAAVCPVGSKRF